MAYSDYQHCARCDCKVLYDGSNDYENWEHPMFDGWFFLLCPDCLHAAPAAELVELLDKWRSGQCTVGLS